MRSRFAAIVAALAFTASAAHAELYSMYTDNLAVKPGTGTSVASSLGIALNVANILTVPGPNNQPPTPPAGANGFISAGLTGSGVIDMNLDASNSGTLFINSSAFTLGNVSFSQSGNLFFFAPYSISVSLVGVGVSITAGPVAVVNGNFSITSATPGALVLNSGLLNYNVNIPSLGANAVGSLDLSTSPLTVDFASLGAVVLSGTADDDNGGNDDGVPDGSAHNLGGPGVTGNNPLDTDGAEVNISFTGVSIASTLALNPTTNLPLTIALNGGVRVSVPEAGSMTLVGLAGVAGLALIRRRRSV
jgi:MYXO-CTERM domain-containing protein